MLADMVKAKRKKEDKFDKLARLIKSESEDIRKDMKDGLKSLEHKVDVGFTQVKRRLDETIQVQLDSHAGRIKRLETKVLS